MAFIESIENLPLAVDSFDQIFLSPIMLPSMVRKAEGWGGQRGGRRGWEGCVSATLQLTSRWLWRLWFSGCPAYLLHDVILLNLEAEEREGRLLLQPLNHRRPWEAPRWTSEGQPSSPAAQGLPRGPPGRWVGSISWGGDLELWVPGPVLHSLCMKAGGCGPGRGWLVGSPAFFHCFEGDFSWSPSPVLLCH